MIEKYSRTCAGIFVILILFTTPVLVESHPVFATAPVGVIVPLYSYPGSYWNQLIQAKNAHPSVPIIAVINPNNGPDSSIDSNYVSGIQQLQSAGIKVLGYVYTSYGSRGTSSAEADINSYNNWYHVSGIFFDEMSNVAGYETYYSNLSSYVKSHGMTMTVGNPGTDTLSSYIGTVDNLMIYENPGLPSLSILGGWHTSYPTSNFSMIAFGVSLPSQSYVTGTASDVGYIYVTDDTLPNPYDTVPSYFGSLVAELDTGSTATVPQSPIGLAASAISSLQINLSWTAPSNNGGSAITGYMIERSTNGGTTWSSLVSNTGSTTTTYSNTGLFAGSTYTYRVSAINAIGTSSPSNTSSATTTTTVPQHPTGVAATTVSSSQINLSWTAPTSTGGSAITGYKIERSTDGGTTWSGLVSNTGSTATTYSDTGLTAGTAYTYRVSAINSVGSSSPSNPVTATTTTTTTTAPQPPTALTTTTSSSSQINLSWIAPSNNGGSAITGYEIDRSTDAGSTWFTIVANTGSTGVTYSNTGLTASTTYTYRVAAINSVGTSSPCNTSSASTMTTTTNVVAITVNSVNLSGNSFAGMWVELHASNGTTLATGYTPVTFNVTSGSQYAVYAANYQGTVFNHWNNGSTNPSITVTPTQNTTLTAYYSTSVTVTVKSVDLSGNPISGLWTVIKSGGTIVAKGYTPLHYTATTGKTYTVTVSNYQNYVFSHWSNGNTNPSITVMPTKNTTLVAYYNT